MDFLKKLKYITLSDAYIGNIILKAKIKSLNIYISEEVKTMKLMEKLQARVTNYEIIKHVGFNHEQGHIWEVKNRRTNEVLTLSTGQITGNRETAANGYKSKNKFKHKDTSKSVTHRMSNTRIYHIWKQLKSRCNNPSQQQYETYSKIGYDPRWEQFSNFYEDMHETYQDGLTIDRIHNDKPYGPNNCRWATRSQQQRNRRATVKIKLYDELEYKACAADLADAFGISQRAFSDRLRLNYDLNTALFKPVKGKDRFEGLSEAEKQKFIIESNKLLEPIINEALEVLCNE